jgi:hypothetical protein
MIIKGIVIFETLDSQRFRNTTLLIRSIRKLC